MLPPSRSPHTLHLATVMTALSTGLVSRDTMDCSASTTADAATTVTMVTLCLYGGCRYRILSRHTLQIVCRSYVDTLCAQVRAA